MHGIIGALFDDPLLGVIAIIAMGTATAIVRSLSGLALLDREHKARSSD